MHLKNHRICHNNDFGSLPQPRREHNKDVIGMIVGVTLDTVEGTLSFSENGIIFDEPIKDSRLKSLELSPAISFEHEGD